MPTVRPPFRLDEVRNSFAPAYWARGQAYYDRGRVLEVRVDADGTQIHAFVAGSDKAPYRVGLVARARNGRWLIEGTCTCPIGYNCKHVVAALFRALDPYANAQATAVEPLPRDKADGAVDLWLEKLSETARRVGAPPGRGNDEFVMYVVDVREYGFTPRVVVEPYVVRRRVSGEVGKPRSYTMYTLAESTAGFVQAVDVVIGRLATAAERSYGNELRRAELLEALLRAAISTGRCHWREAKNPAIALGAARTGEIAWQLGSDGRQRPVLAGGDGKVALLPAVPVWYLDTTTWEAGPIDLGVPAQIASTLLHAPALAPVHASRLRRVWERELAPFAVEPPSVEVGEDVLADDPVPCLLIRTRTVQAVWRRADEYDVAVLAFDYGGTVVDPLDFREEFRSVADDHVKRWPRRFAFERTAEERLKSLGLEAFLLDEEMTLTEFALPPKGGEARWARFLDRVVPQLREEGWRVEVDPRFRHRVVRADSPWSADLVENENHWFELDLGTEIGGHRISLLPVVVEALRRLPRDRSESPLAALENGEPLYAPLPDGTFVVLPADRLKIVLATLVELYDADPLSANGALPVTLAQAAHLDDLEESLHLQGRGGERLRALARSLREFSGLAEVRVPRGFATTLRPYQQTGLNWLQFLRAHDLGGILADDMGLGKTVQALAHILVEKRAGRLGHPSLIVAPTSVLPNWASECRRFARGLRVLTLHGPHRAENVPEIERADIVLTSYPLLVRDAEMLLERRWEIVVLDEAQAIKNPQAKATKIAWRLDAAQRLALTGTPIENHLDELWSILTFAMPGLLGDRKRFTRVFRTPIEKHADRERSAVLAARVRPFVLRRTKSQVEEQLPEKTEIVQRIELGGEQRDLYEAVRLAMHERVAREVGQRGLSRSRIVVLDALLKLRQVCCDPRLVKLASARGVRGSAKLELLLEMLPELIEEGRRVLLFSQFTSMLDLIVPEVRALAIPFVELRGDTTDRATPVRRFQEREVPLFLISLKAGGTGLNLTAADTVIHYDPWWNPAVERQATDRAHRIGQERHVFVYKLVTVGTVEERILEMQSRKAALADVLFEARRDPGKPFDAADLEMLFAPL
ncbi:MAG: DEAD/DEAH box helicase [Vulcanimicrobiaceae bacterium]